MLEILKRDKIWVRFACSPPRVFYVLRPCTNMGEGRIGGQERENGVGEGQSWIHWRRERGMKDE